MRRAGQTGMTGSQIANGQDIVYPLIDETISVLQGLI